MIATAIVSGIGFVALALAVASGPPPVDLTVPGQLTGNVDSIRAAIDAANLLGRPVIWDALVILVGTALWLGGKRFEAILLVVGVIGADAGATVAKIIVARDRPPGIDVRDLITQAGYPSGHMARTVVTAGLLAWISGTWRGWRAPITAGGMAVTILMGTARVAVGEHWFTDVIGAVLYGAMALSVIGVVGGFARPAFERRFGGPQEPGAGRPP